MEEKENVILGQLITSSYLASSQIWLNLPCGSWPLWLHHTKLTLQKHFHYQCLCVCVIDVAQVAVIHLAKFGDIQNIKVEKTLDRFML
jgi:hypothetical protein